MRTPMLFVLCFLTCALTGCGSTCPGLTRVDANTQAPALVQVLFSVTCEDEPVTTLTASDVTLYEGGAEISQSEAEWSMSPHSAALETYTLLLIDVSDSIIDGGTLEVARDVVIDFSTELVDRNQLVSIAVFDGDEEIRTVVPFTDSTTALADAIEAIGPESQLDGSTNLNGAVLSGLDILDQVVTQDVEAELVSVGSLVIFTDGVDRAGRESDAAAQNAVSGTDHHVFVVGLVGEDAVEDLEALAPDGFFQAGAPEDLIAEFGEVTDRLVAEVNKFYLVRYCSPLRKPKTKLRVEVDYEDAKSSIDFSYPTKDFGAGCDAG